ncbi:hypothetical protein ATANTOWER_008330 [Ataeniobius toweri]|uniref:Uncharacterized protein n=1 Tax=Ataeniobius toweri TaxID=208326 RepID=A0ABU7B6B0_9TELE|nr:hypothetical protein [Ataeniobius toweri]
MMMELQKWQNCWTTSTCQLIVRRHVRKKPFLSYHHKRKCVEFAKLYWVFNFICVFWSDEPNHELLSIKTLQVGLALDNKCVVRWRIYDAVVLKGFVRMHPRTFLASARNTENGSASPK